MTRSTLPIAMEIRLQRKPPRALVQRLNVDKNIWEKCKSESQIPQSQPEESPMQFMAFQQSEVQVSIAPPAFRPTVLRETPNVKQYSNMFSRIQQQNRKNRPAYRFW